MNKLISVILPVKNGEKYLKEAIDGIKKQNMDVEIIVVNDASTDNTAELAKSLGCIVINHETCKGQVAGKNTGLEAAHGQYIIFHDGDDVMREGSLQKLYNELEEYSEISVVMAKVQDFVSPDLTNEEKKECSIKAEPFFGLFTGAVLIRKSVFDKTGKFNENINTGEIIEWKTELDKQNILIKKLDFVSTDRRVHKNNYGKTNRNKEFLDYTSVLRARIMKHNKL